MGSSYNPPIAVPVTADKGGTGIANNAASTLTISGNFGTTVTVTGATTVTLPTAGTLATLAGTETLSAKTIIAVDGTVGAPAFSFASSQTTGFRYSGGSTYYVSGGVDQWRFAGNIFLTQPGTGIIIPGPGSVGSPSIQDYNNGANGMWFPGSNTIGFSSNGVLKFTVTSTGIRCVLPTSNAGLVSGDFYTTAGAVMQVP